MLFQSRASLNTMQSVVIRWISYWVIICGILTDSNRLGQKVMADENQLRIRDKDGNPSRHYFEGGTATALCRMSPAPSTPQVTVNGMNATGVTAVLTKNKTLYKDFIVSITLNRATRLGNYSCRGPVIHRDIHRIGYILCDPSEMMPAKLCPEGHFCVLNGTTTSCRKSLECEGVSEPVECKDGTEEKSKTKSCSVYNYAKKIPQGYYLDNSTGPPCAANPQIVHEGKVVQFLTTIPISSTHELEEIRNGTEKVNSLNCRMRRLKGKNHTMSFNGSDIKMAWHEGSPAKIPITCSLTLDKGWYEAAYTRFYILFYGKNRTKFSLVQGSNKVDITSSAEVRLQPKAPFKCTVTTEKGLFVKAVHPKRKSAKKAKEGQDSVDMGSETAPSATYSCIARVYFFEQFGDVRYKLLYEEKRDVTVKFVSGPAPGPTTAVATSPFQVGTGSLRQCRKQQIVCAKQNKYKQKIIYRLMIVLVVASAFAALCVVAFICQEIYFKYYSDSSPQKPKVTRHEPNHRWIFPRLKKPVMSGRRTAPRDRSSVGDGASCRAEMKSLPIDPHRGRHAKVVHRRKQAKRRPHQ